LASWAQDNGIRLPIVPKHCDQAYHMFYMLLPSVEIRQALIEHLSSCGILSVFHYLPLHLSDMGQKFGGVEGDCPITEDISNRLLRLPFYNDLDEIDQKFVVDSIKDFKLESQF
jgi:dTDP-4-amino-4,6-dideoxygalactose transaminase